MKIYDTTTYFEEDLIMDLRFNILNKFVDKFVVCEAKFTHSGKKKNIKFNPNNFKKFKHKIIHIIVENDPVKKNNITKNPSNHRTNSIKRIEHQRNQISRALKNADPDDYVIYSDNDEIPYLNNINFRNLKSKIILFRQKLFYYKFNLFYKKLDWYGSKACKVKDLKNITWRRNIKTKKYKPFRLDTLFSKTKYIDLKIIKEGGWHFTNLKSPKDLLKKYLNDEMHAEFEINKMNLSEIKNKINKRVINYDHFADSKVSARQKQHNKFKLTKVKINFVPDYIKKNFSKYKNWLA